MTHRPVIAVRLGRGWAVAIREDYDSNRWLVIQLRWWPPRIAVGISQGIPFFILAARGAQAARRIVITIADGLTPALKRAAEAIGTLQDSLVEAGLLDPPSSPPR